MRPQVLSNRRRLTANLTQLKVSLCVEVPVGLPSMTHKFDDAAELLDGAQHHRHRHRTIPIRDLERREMPFILIFSNILTSAPLPLQSFPLPTVKR